MAPILVLGVEEALEARCRACRSHSASSNLGWIAKSSAKTEPSVILRTHLCNSSTGPPPAKVSPEQAKLANPPRRSLKVGSEGKTSVDMPVFKVPDPEKP